MLTAGQTVDSSGDPDEQAHPVVNRAPQRRRSSKGGGPIHVNPISCRIKEHSEHYFSRAQTEPSKQEQNRLISAPTECRSVHRPVHVLLHPVKEMQVAPPDDICGPWEPL